MFTLRTVGIGAAVAAFALMGVVGGSPAYAQSPAVSDASSAQASGVTVPASYESPPPKTLGQKVKALVAKITPERMKRDLEFRKAAALFPGFCQHWEEDLHEREINNLQKLRFFLKDGYETSTYTGYGKVTGCESHQSKDGYSIGKITYEEFTYYLVGKSEDEAKHAQPKPISDTHTTEIFRWDNGKWFY